MLLLCILVWLCGKRSSHILIGWTCTDTLDCNHRIAVIHGAFRSCVDEASTRTMWTLYILDRWLSVLMGRPPTIADEAIKLPLPSDVK
jgi:hypothetical protein